MSIDAVVFVPSAPLIVPEVAGGSAALDAELRLAGLDTLSRALESEPDEVVVLAPVPAGGAWAGDASWSFAGFGVSRADGQDRAVLPWSLGIGAWLLDECGWSGGRRYVGVDEDSPTHLDIPTTTRAVVVAVGDGSACRTERAPGHLDPRAEQFDLGVTDCLSRGDPAALAGTDAEVARQLLCAAVPVWRAVASAVGDLPIARSELVAHVAPYGVGYFVAVWSF